MSGERKLIARRNVAKPESRHAHKPLKNYRPAFESIMATGNLSAAPEKLANAMKNLMSAAKDRGVEKEVKQLLNTYASDVGNNIVMLTLTRLERLVSTAPEGQLNNKLEMCGTLMKEFQSAADTIPALLAGSKRLTSSDQLSLRSMRKVVRRGIRRSSSLCPKEISTTIKAEMESGRMDDIKGVTEYKRETQMAEMPQPAMAAVPETQQPQTGDPQSAASEAPSPAQTAEYKADMAPMAHAQALRTPGQLWEEDVKLQDGQSRGNDIVVSSERAKDIVVEKRNESAIAEPARPVANLKDAVKFRKAGSTPTNVALIRAFYAYKGLLGSPKPMPLPKDKPMPKGKRMEKARSEGKAKAQKPEAKRAPEAKASLQETPKPPKSKKPAVKLSEKEGKPKKLRKKTTKKAAPKKVTKKKIAAPKKKTKKTRKKPVRKKTAKVKAAPRQPKRGKKPKKGPLAKKRKKRLSRRKHRKAMKAEKALKKRKRKNSAVDRAKKPKPKRKSVKALKSRKKKAVKMRVKAFNSRKERRRRKAA